MSAFRNLYIHLPNKGPNGGNLLGCDVFLFLRLFFLPSLAARPQTKPGCCNNKAQLRKDKSPEADVLGHLPYGSVVTLPEAVLQPYRRR